MPHRSTPALILGAHLSIVGGIHRALHRAADLGCNALQIFTHSTVQWRMKPLAREEIERFRENVAIFHLNDSVATAGSRIDRCAVGCGRWN